MYSDAPEVHIKKTVINTDEGYEAVLICLVKSDPKYVFTHLLIFIRIKFINKYLKLIAEQLYRGTKAKK